MLLVRSRSELGLDVGAERTDIVLERNVRVGLGDQVVHAARLMDASLVLSQREHPGALLVIPLRLSLRPAEQVAVRVVGVDPRLPAVQPALADS